MLYLADSPKGISEPFFKLNGLAINHKTYINQCLNTILDPFLYKNHKNDEIVFWPVKASSHYANAILEFLFNKNIYFVPKKRIRKTYDIGDRLRIFFWRSQRFNV